MQQKPQVDLALFANEPVLTGERRKCIQLQGKRGRSWDEVRSSSKWARISELALAQMNCRRHWSQLDSDDTETNRRPHGRTAAERVLEAQQKQQLNSRVDGGKLTTLTTRVVTIDLLGSFDGDSQEACPARFLRQKNRRELGADRSRPRVILEMRYRAGTQGPKPQSRLFLR